MDNQVKVQSFNRDKHDDNPGSGTSCDHIISDQPGFIPQSTRTLIYAIFWGLVLYVDHISDFMYNHLITGTSNMEILKSKQAYERVIKSYGVKIKAYRAEKLRFNNQTFTGDLLKGGQTITFVELDHTIIIQWLSHR